MDNIKSCFIIAEAGVNHNGSVDLALQLIDEAAKSGANAVKFQSFKAEHLVSRQAKTAEYQRDRTGIDDQHSMLKKLEMSEDFHQQLFERCKTKNIEFMSTPFDINSAQYLIELGMERLKVPSGELTNIPLLKALCAFNKPIILSTGMALMEEVYDAVEAISSERIRLNLKGALCDHLAILHCTSNYPAKHEDVNLRAMNSLAKEFNLNVGYSDHTDGILVPVAAVAMGATVIEKHFTLDREMDGPDHKASLEPNELSEMVRQIRQIEVCLGTGEKKPSDNELPVRDLVRRSITLASDIPANKPLREEDIILLRPGTGIPPKELEKVLGRCLKVSGREGTQINWQDLI